MRDIDGTYPYPHDVERECIKESDSRWPKGDDLNKTALNKDVKTFKSKDECRKHIQDIGNQITNIYLDPYSTSRFPDKVSTCYEKVHE